MSSLITEDEISHETDIVWLEDIEVLDYVRQSLDRLPTRRGKPAYHRPGRMVGYALLSPQAKASRSSGTFRRRVFWLLPHDRDSDPELYAKGAPAEAIDPRTLKARMKATRPNAPKAARPPPPCANSGSLCRCDGWPVTDGGRQRCRRGRTGHNSCGHGVSGRRCTGTRTGSDAAAPGR